jgi:ketosteroid isomerase-like protein
VLDSKPHPHMEMLRAIYADFSLLAEYASDDIVLHAAGSRGILTGDYFGKEAVLAKEMELFRRSGESLAMPPDDVTANDYFGVVLGHVTAERNGRRYEGEFCGIWRFDNGHIVEHWEHCADYPAAERFFVDEFDEEVGAEPADASHASDYGMQR